MSKPLARLRYRVRKALGTALPAPWVRAAQAAYFAHWHLPRSADGEPDLRVVRALLRPGDLVIDGGANFGRYTAAMAATVGAFGRVVAVEPIPPTSRLLSAVVRRLGLKNVHLVEAALSDAPGTAAMTIPEDAGGHPNFYRARLTTGAAGAVAVPTETLDRLAAALPRPPAFVKLDLEGHERTALAGAAALLDAGAAWLLEMNDDPDDPATDAHAIERDFHARGYRAYWYDADADRLRLRHPGERSVNVFFLQPAHLERLHDAEAEGPLGEP